MALDRQKILSELGNVVNQLQSANCGCLGGLFQKTPNTQYTSCAHAPPSCGGHHHSCHTARPSYNASYPNNNQQYSHCMTESMNHSCSNNNQQHGHCMSDCDPKQMFTEGRNYMNNNIVQPIMKEVYNELKSISPENTVASSPLAAQLGLPCSAPMPQGAQQGSTPNFVNMTDKTPNFVNNSMNRTHNQSFNSMNYKGAWNPRSNDHHAQGLAKFNEMFPGIAGQGDLGFDPMKIAIQMGAMDKNNFTQESTPVTNQAPNVPPYQKPNAPHAPHINGSPGNAAMLNKPMPMADLNPNSVPMNPSEPYNNQAYAENVYNTPMYQNNTQAHYAFSDQPNIQKQNTYDMLNNTQNQPPMDPTNVSNFLKNEIEPEAEPANQTIFEMSNFNDNVCPPSNTLQSDTPEKLQSYENNILGQPIEMLPSHVYHHPVPSLPQTLSPQPLKPRYSNVKSTISKTSLTGNKPGRTISRNNLQRMYNEYRGSQSFIPPKPAPQGVTQSERQLNVSKPNNNMGKILERTGGDSELNKEIIQKIKGDGQYGDVPTAKDLNNNITKKLSPDTCGRAHRNGLQDLRFTSYPMSTAWSFHG